MPPILSSVRTATAEFQRRKRQLLRSLLCAALWPNVALMKTETTLFARNQHSLTFHPQSVLGVLAAAVAEAQSGDWKCPSCGFFCFGSREWCLRCEAQKPPPAPVQKCKLRHKAFMFGEKIRTDPQAGKKSQTHARDCCGVSSKTLFVFGHRVMPEFLCGRASLDGWIHCLASPKDVAMLLGLRRRLQEVLGRLLTKPSAEALEGEDLEVIDAVTSLLVLDVE